MCVAVFVGGLLRTKLHCAGLSSRSEQHTTCPCPCKHGGCPAHVVSGIGLGAQLIPRCSHHCHAVTCIGSVATAQHLHHALHWECNPQLASSLSHVARQPSVTRVVLRNTIIIHCYPVGIWLKTWRQAFSKASHYDRRCENCAGFPQQEDETVR